MNGPFQQLSSEHQKEEDSNTEYFHESKQTFMSSSQQPGVPMPGVSRLVGAILYPVAGRMTRCSEPARHITHFSPEHQTERSQVPGGGEAEFLCDNYQEL